MTNSKKKSVCKMLHELKNRVVSIYLLVIEYPVIYLSLVYILCDVLIVEILRNKFSAISIGLTIALLVHITLPLGLKIVYEKKKDVSQRYHRLKLARGDFVFFFKNIVFAFITISICCLQIFPIFKQEYFFKNNIQSFTNEKVLMAVSITKEPRKLHTGVELEASILEDVLISGIILPKEYGNFLLKISSSAKYQIGSICHIEGNILQPQNMEDFDYVTYLKNKGIYMIINNPVVICKERITNIRTVLIDFKNNLIEKIEKYIKEPQSSLLSGIIFGEKRLFSEEFEKNTRITGVSHIVAASGYNVSILLIGINNILRFLNKKIRIILGLILIWIFCIIAGLSPSIIRACIMTSIILISKLFGRNNTIHITFLFSILLFVFINPLIICDIGFQLSFLATFGLIYLLPSIENLFKKKIQGFAKNYILPTLCCTFATIPVSVASFKTFTLISILSNTLILPVLEHTMLWGILGIAISYFCEQLSLIFFSVVNVHLKYFEYIVNTLGDLNIGYFEVSNILSTMMSFITLILIIILCIYSYPITNEGENHYLKKYLD